MQWEHVSLAVCTLSLAIAAGCVGWISVFSPPARLRKMVEAAEICVSNLLRRVDEVELRQQTWKNELDAYLDQMDDQVTRLQGRTKRADAATKRLANAEGVAQEAPVTREQIVQAARDRVYNQ